MLVPDFSFLRYQCFGYFFRYNKPDCTLYFVEHVELEDEQEVSEAEEAKEAEEEADGAKDVPRCQNNPGIAKIICQLFIGSL